MSLYILVLTINVNGFVAEFVDGSVEGSAKKNWQQEKVYAMFSFRRTLQPAWTIERTQAMHFMQSPQPIVHASTTSYVNARFTRSQPPGVWASFRVFFAL